MTPMSKETRAAEKYRCQFCGYFGTGWKATGEKCPECGRLYDAQLATDEEDD